MLPILAGYTLLSLAIHPALNDEPSYLDYAKSLTAHGLYHAGAWGYMWHGPFLPVLLAPLVAVHAPVQVMRILVGPVVLFAALVAFRALVRPYLRSERAALVATYALAVYLPFLSVIEVIHVEPLAALLFTVAALFIVRSFQGHRRDHLWAAVCLALLALSRLEYGYVLLAALLLSGGWWLARRRSAMARRSTVAIAVALLLCIPWLAYTYSVTHKPFYWGDSGGLSLYWMSAPGNIGDWHLGSETATNPQLAADRPVFAALNHMKPLDWDARLTHVALQNVRQHPAHYLSNVVANVDRLLFNSPYSGANTKTQGLSPGKGMMLYAVPNSILLALLAVAAFVAVRVRRRLGPEILAIAVLAGLGFLIHVPVAAYGRFLIPLVPVLAWLAIAVIAPHVRLATDRRGDR
jgi:4-amino-4-deoxy-L-arabinose transferase-like glycosyltransferase